jgi:hypothetical protein
VQVAGESPAHGVRLPLQVVAPTESSHPTCDAQLVDVRLAQGVSVPVHVEAGVVKEHPDWRSQLDSVVKVLHAAAVPLQRVPPSGYLQPCSAPHPVGSPS